MRKIIHLNYDWKYSADFKEDYLKKDYDDSTFEKVSIPHTNIQLPYNNFNEESFQFVSCYRRKLLIPKDKIGKRVVLHFDGVMTYAKVYVNGQYVCEHKGGYTPFKCDITEHINYDKENILVVMVDSTERQDIPPFGYVIDYLTYGGIYREVRLEFVNDISIDNIFVKTKNVLSKKKELDIDLYLENFTGRDSKLTLAFNLKFKGESVLDFNKEVNLTLDKAQKINVKEVVSNVLLWDNINPNLYELVVNINNDGYVIDEFKVTFGFREVEFKVDGFYLNGKKIKLRGLNRHQSYPYVGYAMPKSAQYKDAEILKEELGVNIVRLSHYPQSKHFLDRCDELGLLVFDEIPGWQHIGNKEWQQVAIKHVEEMIKKDWNRPSIIIWGVRINESQDNDDFYIETNKVAKALDDTRPTGGVRNFEGSHFFEDVYTFNDFIHRGNNVALQKAQYVTKKPLPYLITEHNGHMFPTKKFDNEAKMVEHSLRHLRVLDHMYGQNDISGTIGWCMFDYNTHRDFGSGDRICYHGVMDMFRIPKDAAGVYASQQSEKPVLEVAASMNIGEREAAELDKVYIFTNCDYVKLYKNGEYIGTHYPNKNEYPNVPHPPVIITDFIGNLIEKHEKDIAKKDTDTIKEVLFAIIQYGDKSLPLKYKIKMGMLMYKYKMSYEKAVSFYEKYVGNWGVKSLNYEFEGYINDKPVIKVKKGPVSSKGLDVKIDKDVLIEDETYDVTRVIIKQLDEFNNIQKFSSEVIELEVEGPAQIIGPKKIALIGGSIGFWVKSVGQSGEVSIAVKSNDFDTKYIKLVVNKI